MKKQIKRNSYLLKVATLSSACVTAIFVSAFAIGGKVTNDSDVVYQSTLNCKQSRIINSVSQYCYSYNEYDYDIVEEFIEVSNNEDLVLEEESYEEVFEEVDEIVIEPIEEFDIFEEVYEDYNSPIVEGNVYYIPSYDYYSGFKSYMSYQAFTNYASPQHNMQVSIAYTDDMGFRKVNDRYCVALGTHFGLDIGQYFDLVLQNGTVISCILADWKANQHTDDYNIISVGSACVSEFVVDVNSLTSRAAMMGDVSYAFENWQSPVSYIIVYDIDVF